MPSIDFISVSNTDNQDNNFVILNFRNHSEISNTVFPQSCQIL